MRVELDDVRRFRPSSSFMEPAFIDCLQHRVVVE